MPPGMTSAAYTPAATSRWAASRCSPHPRVKEVALEHGTPVSLEPRTLRDGGEDANIQALAPELIVVVAYGCILPASVLQTPRYWLHQPACFAAAEVPRQCPGAVGRPVPERRHRDGSFHHADGRRAGHRRCSGLREDGHRPRRDQRRIVRPGDGSRCPRPLRDHPAVSRAGTLRPQPQDHAHATLAPASSTRSWPSSGSPTPPPTSTTGCAA